MSSIIRYQAAPSRPRRGSRPPRGARRGSAYIFFLMVSSLVAVIGLSAILITRIERRGVIRLTDATTARIHAKSAIDLGLLEIARDPDWRQNRGAGVWIVDKKIGTGTMRLEVAFGTDGDSDPKNDPVILTGSGVEGTTLHRTEVTAAIQDGALAIVAGSWRHVVD